jgi:hypothetical protein
MQCTLGNITNPVAYIEFVSRKFHKVMPMDVYHKLMLLYNPSKMPPETENSVLRLDWRYGSIANKLSTNADSADYVHWMLFGCQVYPQYVMNELRTIYQTRFKNA